MKISPNVGLNIPEGPDIFNHDTFLKQNFEKIDNYLINTDEIPNINAQLAENTTKLNAYVYHAKDLGLKADGTDESTTMNTALTQLKNTGKRVVLMMGKEKVYKFDSTISIDPSFVVVDGNFSTFDFTGNTGIALRVVGSASPPYYQVGMGLKNLELKRTGAQGSSIGIVFGGDTAVGVTVSPKPGTSHLDLEKVFISGFNKGIDYRSDSYIIRHFGVDIFSCNYALYKTAYANSGENYSFVGGAIFNNNYGIYAEDGDFRFFGTSIDYMTNAFMWVKGGAQIYFEAGFIEKMASTSAPCQFIAEETGTIVITSSRLVIEYQTNATTKLFKSTGFRTAGIHIKDCFLTLRAYRSTDGTLIGTPADAESLVDGTGIVNFSNTHSFSQTEYEKYLLNEESSTLGRKSIDLEAYQGNGTKISKWNAGNVIISQDTTPANLETGTFSWKVEKTTAAATPAKFRIYVPLRKSGTGKVGWRLRMRRDGSVTNHNLTLMWASVLPDGQENSFTETLTASDSSTVSNTKRFNTHLVTNSETILSADSTQIISTWGWKYKQVHTTRPMWATHYILEFDMTPVGATQVYIDSLEFYEF